MKIALCLSGQPRNADKTLPFIYQNIINANRLNGDEVDVFIHLNYDSENSYIEKSHLDNNNCYLPKFIDKYVIEAYKPTKYLIEKPSKKMNNPNIKIPPKRLENCHKMNKHRNMSDEEQSNHIIKQMTFMFYSIFKCNELKEKYAQENGFVYDYVIRLRFDAVPLLPLICRNYDSNYIYYQNIGQKDELISDWMNFGSNMIMNVYSSVYLNLEYINSFRFFKKDNRLENTLEPSDECSGLSEHMIRDIMTLYKIPKKMFDVNLKLI